MLLRREQPHPGAQLRFTDIDGHRYQVFITDLPEADPAYLDALYRGRGRMECRIRDAKDTGLTNLPSHSFAINTAWLTLVLIASRPPRLDQNPLPGRRTGHRRAQTAALHPAPNRGARPLSAAHHTAAGRRLAMGHRPGRRVHPTPRMVPSTQLKHPPPLQPRPPPPHRWCTTPRNRPPRTHQTIRSPPRPARPPPRLEPQPTPGRLAHDNITRSPTAKSGLTARSETSWSPTHQRPRANLRRNCCSS